VLGCCGLKEEKGLRLEVEGENIKAQSSNGEISAERKNEF
jgi:hypothetical protein